MPSDGVQPLTDLLLVDAFLDPHGDVLETGQRSPQIGPDWYRVARGHDLERAPSHEESNMHAEASCS